MRHASSVDVETDSVHHGLGVEGDRRMGQKIRWSCQVY
jgi:hypothetical protein